MRSGTSPQAEQVGDDTKDDANRALLRLSVKLGIDYDSEFLVLLDLVAGVFLCLIGAQWSCCFYLQDGVLAAVDRHRISQKLEDRFWYKFCCVSCGASDWLAEKLDTRRELNQTHGEFRLSQRPDAARCDLRDVRLDQSSIEGEHTCASQDRPPHIHVQTSAVLAMLIFIAVLASASSVSLIETQFVWSVPVPFACVAVGS